MKLRVKVFLCLGMIACVLLPVILVSRSSLADVSANVSLNPPVISGESLATGSNFTLTASIQGVVNLWGWSLGLSWDPSILQMMNYSEGSFLSSAGQTSLTASPIDNNDGIIQNLNDVLASNNSVSGSGDLASFTFQIIGSGSTAINLTNVELLGPVSSSSNTNQQIPVTVTNAVFNGAQASAVQTDPSTATGVLSAVYSGTTSQSSITLGPSPDPKGSTLKIDIYISGAANVWAWSLPTVTWNPAVLELTKVVEGPWLQNNVPNDDTTLFIGNSVSLFDNTNGAILGGLSDAITGNDVAATSAGVLATLTFNVTGYGTSPVTIAGATLYASPSDTTGVSATCNSATVDVISPTASSSPSPSPSPSPTPTPTPTPTSSGTHSPIASFTPQNGTVYTVGDTILLNADPSAAGSDNGVTCKITNYAWLIEYSNYSLFGAYSGEEVAFSVLTPTDLQVILIVTAPDANPSPSSSYTNTSTTSAWIQIESAVQQEPTIKVSTDKGAYGPQQLVTMYALVTFQGAPIVDKQVAFAVLFPNGTVCSLTTASTNGTGYATWSFRLPWPSSNPQSLFGTWSIVASVDVCQVVITGTVTFTFNYSIVISSIQVLASVQRSESMSVKVTLQSTANIQGVLSATICDSQQVPIAFSTTKIDVTAGVADTVTMSFTIPSWAFVGTATVYVNVLTALPTNGGVALCPQETANFQITS
jgi:hypothetical protein